MMRKTVFSFSVFAVLAVALVLAVFAPAFAAENDTFPPIVPLPDNFRGEGVATGHGAVIYAGSLANGAIYEANLRTGQGQILVEGVEGRFSVGMNFDPRSGYLFVAGGPNAVGRVYDTDTGALLAEYPMAGGQAGNFVNDVIVTGKAVYFTNSFAPIFYRVPLGPGGELPDLADVEAVDLSGEWEQVGGFNANGIEASQNGRHLLIVSSAKETLYRVDPDDGEARAVDLGGYALTNGDGLVLNGRNLYVVQNRLNQIAKIELANDLLSGEVTEVITNDGFRVPTTAAKFGSYIYAVNARFGEDLSTDPSFEIVQVKR